MRPVDRLHRERRHWASVLALVAGAASPGVATAAPPAAPSASPALPAGHPPLAGAPGKVAAPSSATLPAGHPPLAGAPGKVAAPSSSTLPAGHPNVGAGSPSSATLPAGHPNVGAGAARDDDEDDLPPGHPPPRSGAPATRTPEPAPEDSSERDDSLPPGTIVVEVRDKNGAPVPGADITLGILQQSVAKGESRRRTTQKADDAGRTRFDNLERGAGVAYRISIPWTTAGSETATYAAPPFQLDLNHGQRVRVHVFPVASRIEETLLGMQGIAYFELKDDVIQVDELFQVYNMGSTTWVPSDVIIDLPSGFRGFNSQREMSDTGFDVVAGRGAKMRGTFGPGQHDVQFRYQIPYEGAESVKIALSLPPRVIRMRVIAEASKTMTLHVDDFPNALSDANQRGQRVLLTERQARPGESPLNRVAVTLDNIPTEGSARWITVAITAATVVFGVYTALQQEKSKQASRAADRDTERARARLVAEIAALDAASKAGEIGPQAHSRIRQALIDSLAHVMAQSDAHEPT